MIKNWFNRYKRPSVESGPAMPPPPPAAPGSPIEARATDSSRLRIDVAGEVVDMKVDERDEWVYSYKVLWRGAKRDSQDVSGSCILRLPFEIEFPTPRGNAEMRPTPETAARREAKVQSARSIVLRAIAKEIPSIRIGSVSMSFKLLVSNKVSQVDGIGETEL